MSSGMSSGGRREAFVSVDVETAGPAPSRYSMLSIGACLVEDLETTFYAELKPDRTASVPEAMSVGRLSFEVLAVMGEEPAEAMTRFVDWVGEVVPEDHQPVFVGFNAAFDWMFVADYLDRYVGTNPFGHTALDIKALAMGRTGSTWAATSMRYLAPTYLGDRELPHHALADAQLQAELFRAVRGESPTTEGETHDR